MELRLPLASHTLGANGNKNVFQTSEMTPRTRCRAPLHPERAASTEGLPETPASPASPASAGVWGRLGGRRLAGEGREQEEHIRGSANANACAIGQGSVW